MASHEPKPTPPGSTNREFVLEPIAQPQATLPDRLHRHRHSVTGLMFSIFAHTAMLVILLWFVQQWVPLERRISITAEVERESPVLHQPQVNPLDLVEIEVPEESVTPMDLDQQQSVELPEVETSAVEKPVTGTIAELDQNLKTENIAPEQPTRTLPIGGGLAGRDSTARARLAAAYGGSLASEQAVEDGLKWIVNHQQRDGSWGLKHQRVEGCHCPDEGERESKTAATGLALLAILGAGYTDRVGPYQVAVRNGLNYLTKNQRPNGGWLGDSDRMYAHPIATLALSEAYQLNQDGRLIESIRKARDYMVQSQNQTDSRRKGSWGYEPGQPGDITLSGWHIAAFKSCQRAGLETPGETWNMAERFVDSLSNSEGRFGYTDPLKGTAATTAVGLFSKMLMGLHRESPLLVSGGDYLAELGPSNHDIYYNYYATQVLFHRQGDDWKTWNQTTRDYLVGTQVKQPGHPSGSWYFPDNHGKVGGRFYTTCLAVMTLEVYYRYLPLYEEILQPSAGEDVTLPAGSTTSGSNHPTNGNADSRPTTANKTGPLPRPRSSNSIGR